MAATKKPKEEGKEIKLILPKDKKVTVHLVGDGTLILCKKSQSFENEEIYKQSHKKGASIPDNISAKLHYNLWEKLITSISWEKPYKKHDSYDDYTEEEYRELMKTNRPCISAKAFMGSFTEAFISHGYKESTGRTGADFTRCFNVCAQLIPVDFVSYDYDIRLVPNNTVSHTNVLAQNNFFQGWSCDLEISFLENIFELETILSIISMAGSHLGIGTRRKDGFGRYHIESSIG